MMNFLGFVKLFIFNLFGFMIMIMIIILFLITNDDIRNRNIAMCGRV